MKKIVCALFLGILYGGLAVAGVQEFTIENQTGGKITSLYISPSAQENWDKNVLSVDSLAVGGECDILVSRDENAEVWDIMAIAPDGNSVKWPGLRLNDFSKITLSLKKGRAEAYYE